MGLGGHNRRMIMSKGRYRFKQAEIGRAIKGVESTVSGLRNAR
jgi:hypothetical protein